MFVKGGATIICVNVKAGSVAVLVTLLVKVVFKPGSCVVLVTVFVSVKICVAPPVDVTVLVTVYDFVNVDRIKTGIPVVTVNVKTCPFTQLTMKSKKH